MDTKTIYLDKRRLLISEEPVAMENGISLDWESTKDLPGLLRVFEHENGLELNLVHRDIKVVMQALKKHYNVVEAAGGVVYDAADNLLCIYRRNRWDLPKGHVDQGEKKRAAALREVTEETGLSGMKITNKLMPTWHLYNFHGARVLKRTHWYLMRTEAVEPELKAQAEEGILEAVWLNVEALSQRKAEFWRSLMPLLEKHVFTQTNE